MRLLAGCPILTVLGYGRYTSKEEREMERVGRERCKEKVEEEERKTAKTEIEREGKKENY